MLTANQPTELLGPFSGKPTPRLYDTSHIFRHSFATHLLAGVSVAVRNWTTLAARTEPAGCLHGDRRKPVAPRDRDAEASHSRYPDQTARIRRKFDVDESLVTLLACT